MILMTDARKANKHNFVQNITDQNTENKEEMNQGLFRKAGENETWDLLIQTLSGLITSEEFMGKMEWDSPLHTLPQESNRRTVSPGVPQEAAPFSARKSQTTSRPHLPSYPWGLCPNQERRHYWSHAWLPLNSFILISEVRHKEFMEQAICFRVWVLFLSNFETKIIKMGMIRDLKNFEIHF